MAGALWLLDGVARESSLFAAVGFLVGGIDDLAVDAAYLLVRARRRWSGDRGIERVDQLPATRPGRLAVFVPAWDEAAVIGPMLATALGRYRHPCYRIYVGCYPNDGATRAAVTEVAARDARVVPVVLDAAGPTTKADCLNALWRALVRDDAQAGHDTRAVVLHDAEDVVHADELTVVDALVGDGALQLPVVPLVQPRSRLVSGHYLDEFAEAHGKALVVREALGAGLPLAGVGCALAVPLLARIAARRGGEPFDPASLTEDYELGLAAAREGRPATFVRVLGDDGRPVATRAYFPATVGGAVRQKARWMTGIALAGWDRTGWSEGGRLGDHWMRMRDRRAPLAVLILAAAYLSLLALGVAWSWHAVAGTPAPAFGPWLSLLLGVNAVLLLWRLLVRAGFTGAAHGWREAASVPLRMLVANGVALLAAQRALGMYVGSLAGRPLTWDKTAHAFPDLETVRG
jgi:bacteriophage N4 adsorption protein B